MGSSVIGNLQILVGADLSGLQDDLAQIPAMLAEVGSSIGSLSAGSGDLSGFSSEVSSVQEQLTALSSASPDLSSEVSAVDQLSASVEELGSAADTTSNDLAAMGAALGDAGVSEFGEAVNQAEADLSGLGSGAEQVAPEVEHVGSAVEETGGAAEAAREGLESMKEGLVELAAEFGIALGAFELLKEALESTAEIQKAQAALTVLGGDAEKAEAQIEGLREMAIAEGLDFPKLVQAAQRMEALGVSAEAIPSALQGIADAAAATGRDIDSVANAFDRMASTGTAGARQLVMLGTSLEGIAAVMGTTTDEAAKMFKALDEDQRVEVLTQAMQRFQGAAEAVAKTLSGEWQTAKDQVDTALEEIGTALAGAAGQFMGLFSALPGAVSSVVDGFKNLASAIGDVLGPLGKLVDIPGTLQAFGNAIGLIATALGGVVTAAHAAVLILTDLATMNFSQLKTDSDAAGAALAKVGDQMGKILTAEKEVADTPAWSLNDKLALTVSGTAALNAQLSEAKTQLSLVAEAYKLGLATQEDVAAAEIKVVDAFAAANPTLVTAGATFGALHPTLEQLQGDLVNLEPALAKLGVTSKDGGDKVDELETAMRTVEQGFHSGQVSATEYQEAVDKFVKSMRSLQGAFQEATEPVDLFSRAAAAALDEAIGPKLQDNLDRSALKIEALGLAFEKSETGILTLDGALKALGQKTMTDAQDKVKLLQEALASLKAAAEVGVVGAAEKARDALMQLDAAEIQVSDDKLNEQSLGIPDLDTLRDKLKNDTDAYNDLVNNGVLTANQAIEGQRRILQDQIAVLQQTGGNTTDLKLRIEQLNKSLQDQPTLWSTVQTAIQNVGKTLSSGLGQAIDSVIAGTSTLGQAFSKLGLQIVDTIVNTIIANGIKVLMNALSGVTDSLGGIGGALGKVLTGGGTTAVGAGVNAATNAGSTAASAGSSAASSGSAAAGSTLSTVSSIAGIVGAVADIGAGITAGLQASTTNDHLFHIMSDTAYIKGYLADIHGFSHDASNTLQALLDWEQGPIHLDLVNIAGELQSGVDPRLDTLNQVVGRLYDLELVQTAVAARGTPLGGNVQVTLAGSDPRQVAMELAGLLGLSAPNFA